MAPTAADQNTTNGSVAGRTERLACVLGIGTANPERVVLQTDFARDFISTLNSSARIQNLTNKISKKYFTFIEMYLIPFI